MNVDSLIDDIIRREGSEYTNHPADKGGPTKYGITLATLKQARGFEMNALDVKALSESDARQIYQKMYVRPFLDIPDTALQYLLVDSAVNHGIKRAIIFLQTALGVRADGVIGPKTVQAAAYWISKGEQASLYYNVLSQRIRFYGRIITDTPSQAVFAAGWMNRVCEFVKPYAVLA